MIMSEHEKLIERTVCESLQAFCEDVDTNVYRYNPEITLKEIEVYLNKNYGSDLAGFFHDYTVKD